MNPVRRLAAALAAMLATLAVAGTITAGSAADATPRHVTTTWWEPAPSNPPPFWHRAVPNWCQEDMPCWIGSIEDGRGRRAAMHAWRYELRHMHDYEPGR